MAEVKFAKQVVIALLMSAAMAAPAPAQRVDPSVPSGSPLNGKDNDDSYRNTQSAPPMYDPTGGGAPVSATNIIDTDRNLINIDRALAASALDSGAAGLKPPPPPSEFEKYLERVLGRHLPRFGANLLLPASRDFATPATAAVPPDYILNVGDVISIYMTGSVEGSVEREIDNEGKIFLPKIGEVRVAGIRYADLRDRISAAIGRQYRGYGVTVGIRRLRGIRVYVTGFANSPGAFTVSSLSTMANAIFQAGGPASGGSFRSMKLYRNGQEVADFDLYDLVRGGNRVNDAVLQNEDVLFIPPAGQQIAIVGSVQEEAIYEAKPGESVEQMLAAAGGPNTLGDPTRVILYRTSDMDQPGPRQISRDQAAMTQVQGGDVLQILSKGSLIQPIDRQSVLVRVEGEVNRPGNYYVPPNTPTSNILQLAGGLSPRAFPYGTRFVRESVRAQQQESFEEAIRQLELTLAAAPLTADRSQSESERGTQIAGAKAVLERLRQARPDGRLVLDISPSAQSLPENILLENNDRIYVPPRASTVGVFGAVYRPASFLIGEARPMKVKDYVDQAGGTIRAADRGEIFVVRANGEVLSRRRGALNSYVYPGDVVFVPVKTQSGTFWAKFKDITTTLFQLGLTAATVVSVTDNN